MGNKKFRKRKTEDTLGVQKPLKDIVKEFKIQRSISFLKEYSQCSTIHGVQHIFREGETAFHRIIWSVLFLTCLSGATYMTFSSWENYIKYPIVMTVEDTHFPLYDIVFPALSLCPTNKILLPKAKDYLSKHIKSEFLNHTQLEDFLTALTLLQHPVYSQMEYYLNKSREIIPQLSFVNLSELMYNSMPSCEDVFVKCYWQGVRTNCCQDLFSFQKSEEGFCYSFNSLTSLKFRNCSYLDVRKKGCEMKTSPSVGPTTGLEVFFRKLDPQKYEAIELSGSPKLKVQLHSPNEFPEAGMGTMLPIGDLNKLIIAVKITMTSTTDEVRRMSEEERGCTFKDEKIPYLTLTFSQNSCLMECRIDYMIKMCGCVPYYLHKRDAMFPVCNSVQLYCILNISESLRFYKPPNYAVNGFHRGESKNPLDCQHCLPTCNEIKYDVVTELTRDPFSPNHEEGGYIDVFYKNSGAVKYKRDLSYDFVKLLVDMGGIGGLFLGGSLLSILEVIYWILKSLISFSWSLKHDNFKRKHILKDKRLFVHTTVLYD